MGPSTHQVGQGGTQGLALALAPRGILQLSCAWLCPGTSFLQLSQTLSPSHCLHAHLTGLGPCELSVWGHVCPGHSPDPNQGRCPQALLSPHPQILGCGCSLA